MSRVLVVDASAMVEVLRRTSLGDRTAEAMRHATLAAPAHMDAEVLSALGRLARAAVLADALVARSLRALRELPIQRYPVTPLLQPAWELRHNISLRDGLYVACAQAIGATLLTLDTRLAGSAPAEVDLID